VAICFIIKMPSSGRFLMLCAIYVLK
jgi:hypothetical protein